MRTESLTMHTRRTTAEPCPCGCAPCEEACCHLDCLVQPRFFCGQLLTDADLTALLNWSQDKFRLARYRHGWGVVCGLEVHCDPKNPRGVIVYPGYAIDCCGNDLIVCEEYRYDLSGQCPQPECLEPVYQRASRAAPPTEEQGEAETAAAYAAAAFPTPENLFAGGLALDLYLHYHEEGTLPQTSLGRTACGEAGACQFSRVRETYRLVPKLVEADQDPRQEAADRWEEAFEKRIQEARAFADAVNALEDGEAIRQRLSRWVDRNHLAHFCFLHDWIRTAAAEELLDPANRALALFWLALDHRQTWLSCGCASCEVDTGIRLARVWLRPPGEDASECLLIAVDGSLAYRRPLHLDDCWPAGPHCANLAQALWQPQVEAERLLGAAGLTRVVWQTRTLPEEWNAFWELLNCDLIIACDDQEVYAQVVDFGEPWGTRVISFCTESQL